MQGTLHPLLDVDRQFVQHVRVDLTSRVQTVFVLEVRDRFPRSFVDDSGHVARIEARLFQLRLYPLDDGVFRS